MSSKGGNGDIVSEEGREGREGERLVVLDSCSSGRAEQWKGGFVFVGQRMKGLLLADVVVGSALGVGFVRN